MKIRWLRLGAMVAALALVLAAAFVLSAVTAGPAAPSMEIFFAMLRGDTLVVPGGGPPALPTVAASDLGEIAAQAMKISADICIFTNQHITIEEL